ncbi:hypothetical protein [Dactylosporangium sp. NPDC049140]|uniref:hypothetical protein n=1 Tax=Dactylosporangium sp. NPDC049140 TaxID=3155647 RepID=UPI0033DC5D41
MRWPFRVAMSTAAVMLFDQAVFAGQFLAGTFGALPTHRANATYSGIAVLVAAAAGVLVRWPGRGPLWPALACLGLFGLIALQIVVGFARMLTVHVPLGVSIIGLAAALAVWSWRPTENAERRPAENAERPAESAERPAENAERPAESAGQPVESAGRAA